MKRFLFIFILLHASAAYPVTLSKIPVSQIGTKIKNIVSSNDFLLPTTMAMRSGSNYEAAANLLTVPLYAYNPVLGIAASTVIGFAFDPPVSLKPAYDNADLKLIPGFQELINQLFGYNPAATPAVNDVINFYDMGGYTCDGSCPRSHAILNSKTTSYATAGQLIDSPTYFHCYSNPNVAVLELTHYDADASASVGHSVYRIDVRYTYYGFLEN